MNGYGSPTTSTSPTAAVSGVSGVSADDGRPRSGSGATKRKSDESGIGTQHSRAKRNRYISIACNECKRRKIKCAETARSSRADMHCLSQPATEKHHASDVGIWRWIACMRQTAAAEASKIPKFKQMNENLTCLQDQVDNLSQMVNALRAHHEASVPNFETPSLPDDNSQSFSVPHASVNPDFPFKIRRRQHAKHPRFQGPTSSAFSFDVARSSLQTMGITEGGDLIDDGIATQDETLIDSLTPQTTPPVGTIPHPSKDPLWTIGKDEAIRLIHVYEEEMGMMYPILDIEKVLRHARNLYAFLTAAARTGFAQLGQPGADGISDDDTNVLKLVLANALMVEGSGQSELGTRLFEGVRSAADSRIWGCEIDLKGLSILVLASMYYFHQDEESLAWRLIGITARLCVELGLHQRDTLMKGFGPDEEQRWAIRLFWSVYCLDRRWSLGTGMPFALQDSEIDPMLPEPDNQTAYLITMIAYGRISSKVWKSLAGLEHSNNEAKREQIGYLDYQLLQWHNSIPDSLKYLDPATGLEVAFENRGIRRLRVLLYLRSNQMRTLIYRPILHSATSIMEHRDYAMTAVDVARETVRILSQLNQTSDIYRSQQICFNYFLVSALAALFLAVSHAPAQFSALCRDEFYMALDLVKGFSSKSYISKRLWRTIKGLKEVGPKLGLPSRRHSGPQNQQHHDHQSGDPGTDAHSSAAVAMAGLAGHNVDDLAIYQQNKGISPMGQSPLDGPQMSYELTHLFEAAGGYTNVMNNNNGAPQPQPQPQQQQQQQQQQHQNPGIGINGSYVTPPPGCSGNTIGPAPSLDGMTPMFGNEEEFSKILQNLF
ncbi:MAG: hypothetical protein M1837_001407 [Sclerophora amabilis]|nr:MAG: hypothetical protein M1837_001407 [Sclerophora amabilis]